MQGMMAKRSLLATVVALCVLSVCAGPAGAAEPKAIGPTGKWRVLVDKVLMAANGWVMTEEHVRQIAEAGFNVFSPRTGGADMAKVRQTAAWASKHGIYTMPWMRGTLTAKAGNKLIWANGAEQDLYSPNSDELWDWMTGLILEYARISKEQPALIGVFLDYENYAENSQGNAYDLSYDDKIMGEFAAAKGITLPALAPKERAPWLKQKGLEQEFSRFQIDGWRARCRTLRQAVDAINPRFLFCVYPAPGTLHIEKGIWPEWGTKAAPLVLADAATYGRPSGFLPHAESLTANGQVMRKNFDRVRRSGTPVLYLGGIDPSVEGADPEFSGKNAVLLSQATDGYWIFYEGPTYGKQDHADYWKWFTWANRSIAAGQLAAWKEKREAPDHFGVTTLDRKTDKPQVALHGMKSRISEMLKQDGRFEVHDLRGDSPEYLRQLDVIVLQNLNADLPRNSPFSRTLRSYVEAGGALFFVHDTAWFMDSPFPEIAVRARPKHKVESERHVVETDLKTDREHPALAGIQPGVVFSTEFRDHMIFKAGKGGTTVIRNTFGDPVYVVGTCGKGRVAFSGSYYGYHKDLQGTEKQAFLSILHWLARKDSPAR